MILGAMPPRRLIRYAIDRLYSLSSAVPRMASDLVPEINAAVPLYRVSLNKRSKSQSKLSTVNAGTRLIVSLEANFLVLDIMKAGGGYSSGLHVGDAGQLWIEAISAATTRRSFRSKIVETRILQVPAVHAEYIWLKCDGADRFLLVNKLRGIEKGQRSKSEADVAVSVRKQVRERIKKRDSLSSTSEN